MASDFKPAHLRYRGLPGGRSARARGGIGRTQDFRAIQLECRQLSASADTPLDRLETQLTLLLDLEIAAFRPGFVKLLLHDQSSARQPLRCKVCMKSGNKAAGDGHPRKKQSDQGAQVMVMTGAPSPGSARRAAAPLNCAVLYFRAIIAVHFAALLNHLFSGLLLVSRSALSGFRPVLRFPGSPACASTVRFAS
jgi:hypothetical protein